MDRNDNINEPITSTTPTEPNVHIFAQSDGGCRHRGTSATGYAIKVHNNNNNTTQDVAEAGTIIQRNLSSLTVETIALDQLTKAITEWISTTPPNTIQHTQPHTHTH